MNKELEELSETLISIYQKNLFFLKNNFFDIYMRIEDLSLQIESGKVKEKYTLEFIDGYFDVLNNINNGMYYHTNSYEDADKRAEFVDTTTNNSLELLRRNPFTGKLLSASLYKDAMPIIDYINDNLDFNKIEYEKIYKFIFIGTGLGFHIQEISKKINPFTTIIIEPDIEMFRLSLFVTDYTFFDNGNKKLFLSIGDDTIKRTSDLREFFRYHNYMNYNVKYYSLLESQEYIKKEVIDFFGRNSETSFPYKLIVENLIKTVSFIRNKDRFLSVPLMNKYQILNKKKVLHISAGPSLDNYINWIKKNQHKFIIVCVDVIVKKLEKHKIIPDIVVSIDPSHLCANYLNTVDTNFLNNSAIILLSQQDSEVFEIIKNKHYYFSQVLPLVKDIGFLGSTPNVGTFSFEMAIYLGAEEIYLIGNDAAFNQKTGTRYAKDSSFIKIDPIDYQTKEEYLEEQVVEVKGNLRETIKTNKGLLAFKTDYEHSIMIINDFFQFNAYNLSDGAYIEGLKPMSQKEINEYVKDDRNAKFDIIHELDKISVIIDNIEFKNEIKIFDNIISKTKKFQKKVFSSRKEFLENKLTLSIEIIEQTKNKSNDVFANIFLRYIGLIDLYINFILNIKQDNLHTKSKLNDVSRLWAQGIIFLFEDMKKINN